MKDLKLYICAGVFILLTAVKILSPQLSEDVAEGIKYVLNMEKEQTETIIALGSSLTKDDIIKVFDFAKDAVT